MLFPTDVDVLFAIFERQLARKALCRPDVHIILGSLHELHVRAMAGFQKYHCNPQCVIIPAYFVTLAQ